MNNAIRMPDVQSSSSLAMLLDEWRQGHRVIRVRINDRLDFEIKDEGSFKALCALLERLESIAAIQEGLDDFEAGRAMSLDEFKQQLRGSNGIPR